MDKEFIEYLQSYDPAQAKKSLTEWRKKERAFNRHMHKLERHGVDKTPTGISDFEYQLFLRKYTSAEGMRERAKDRRLKIICAIISGSISTAFVLIEIAIRLIFGL